MKFGLTHQELELLNQLCVNRIKATNGKVWIFGSRARGDYRPTSDIDILYSGPTPFPPGLIAEIRYDLEESRLPYKVDLVAEEDVAESYKKNVLKDRVEL